MHTLAKVVGLLRSNEEISGEAIAGELGITRSSVWKHINTLRERGFEIEGSPRGYRMSSEPDLLLPERVEGLLKAGIIGKSIDYHERCDSSNEVAKRLARKAGKEGSIIVCEEQSAGRGRLGRKWVSPRGGVWVSVILKPSIPPEEATKLGLLSSLSVGKTLRKLYRLDACLKWPNDVLIGEKKVCGVLVEVEAEIDVVNFAVVGIGLNANLDVGAFPEEVRKIATTLREELKGEVDRAELLAVILKEMEENYTTFIHRGFRALLEEYEELCTTLGSEVKVVQDGREIRGTAVEIDRKGALILLTPEGRERITYGDCFHLRALE